MTSRGGNLRLMLLSDLQFFEIPVAGANTRCRRNRSQQLLRTATTTTPQPQAKACRARRTKKPPVQRNSQLTRNRGETALSGRRMLVLLMPKSMLRNPLWKHWWIGCNDNYGGGLLQLLERSNLLAALDGVATVENNLGCRDCPSPQRKWLYTTVIPRT